MFKKVMFKKVILGLALAIMTTGAWATSTPVLAGDAPSCIAIGGLGMANFAPEKDGTTTIVAPLTGTFANAAGKITGSRETATGLELDMEHYFMNNAGGFFLTKDIGVLTRIPGKKDRYMIEISYDIQVETTSGPFKGFKGGFKSYGLVDLKNNQGLVRYSGKICK